VLWQDNLTETTGGRLYGITRFDPNQIIINTQQSDKEAVLTYFHEALHAFSDSYEVGLTETQVRKLEKAFPYLLDLFRKLEGEE
jgi:Zn-dependent peptidase ImmA (M78 family)